MLIFIANQSVAMKLNRLDDQKLIGTKVGEYFEDEAPKNSKMRVKKVFGGIIEFNVPENQYIESIKLSYNFFHEAVVKLKFITKKGVESEEMGYQPGTTVNDTIINVRPYFVGIYGRSNRYIEQLGFISNVVFVCNLYK